MGILPIFCLVKLLLTLSPFTPVSTFPKIIFCVVPFKDNGILLHEIIFSIGLLHIKEKLSKMLEPHKNLPNCCNLSFVILNVVVNTPIPDETSLVLLSFSSTSLSSEYPSSSPSVTILLPSSPSFTVNVEPSPVVTLL